MLGGLDVPTGNLDSPTSDAVVKLLKMTSETFAQTIVVITHNPDIAARTDMQIRIEKGKQGFKDSEFNITIPVSGK